MHNKYGCKPPVTDVRDYKLAKATADSLPIAYAPIALPAVKNQGSVSSCVAHAASSILEYHDLKIGNNTLSTNFIYGIQKSECGHDGPGMYLRDACKIVTKYGDMLYTECSGNTEVPKCWSIAEKALKDKGTENSLYFRVESYFNCKTIEEIKRAIYNYGPVLASIKWYDTFKVNKNGVLTGESKGDYGYHAVMIYGWNERGFTCQNSWGTHWGEKGRFILPYEIPVAEAKGIVDAEDSFIVKPKRNAFLDVIYKILNFILNLFNK